MNLGLYLPHLYAGQISEAAVFATNRVLKVRRLHAQY